MPAVARPPSPTISTAEGLEIVGRGPSIPKGCRPIRPLGRRRLGGSYGYSKRGPARTRPSRCRLPRTTLSSGPPGPVACAARTGCGRFDTLASHTRMCSTNDATTATGIAVRENPTVCRTSDAHHSEDSGGGCLWCAHQARDEDATIDAVESEHARRLCRVAEGRSTRIPRTGNLLSVMKTNLLTAWSEREGSRGH